MKTALWLALLLPCGLHGAEIPASQAGSHVGENATVCGLITGVHLAAKSRGEPTFINFDKRYPNQDFTVMIWHDDITAFGDLKEFVGQQMCAEGVITRYRGKPEMVIKSPRYFSSPP